MSEISYLLREIIVITVNLTISSLMYKFYIKEHAWRQVRELNNIYANYKVTVGSKSVI